MKSIAFITPEDAEFGFRLAGVRQFGAALDELPALLKKVISQGDTGLIVIDERLLSGANQDLVTAVEKNWHGVILALPSPKRAGVSIEDFAVRLMRRAIGYHVRLRV